MFNTNSINPGEKPNNMKGLPPSNPTSREYHTDKYFATINQRKQNELLESTDLSKREIQTHISMERREKKQRLTLVSVPVVLEDEYLGGCVATASSFFSVRSLLFCMMAWHKQKDRAEHQ